MMICPYCGNKRALGDATYMVCKRCGIEQYEPFRRANLYKRGKPSFIGKLIGVVLFKLYYFSVWVNKRLEGEVRKPRFGEL